MSYRITITVPQHRLASVLASLPKGMKFEIERFGSDEEAEAGVKTSSSDVIMTLGHKEPAAGTLADKIGRLLMALEAKHGPGRVTRKQLNEAMKKAKMTESQLSCGIPNAVTSGYLKRGAA